MGKNINTNLRKGGGIIWELYTRVAVKYDRNKNEKNSMLLNLDFLQFSVVSQVS